MMINIKSLSEIELMRRAGKISKNALIVAGKLMKPGTTTAEVDHAVEQYILSEGAMPSFKGYGGFPASACISVNEEVIHGIPGDRVMQSGDIVSVDVGACYEGYHGDCAATFAVGDVSEDKKALIEVTRQSFYEGIKFARPGYRISDISSAIQAYAESQGYSVVRQYVGHGIGTSLHEAPEVPNFGRPGYGPRLIPGMTLAVEPMINMGVYDVRVLSDDWTVVTVDGMPSAHYENTILITDNEPEILTLSNEICEICYL
jgi:methionyl aminopeptidase